MLILETIAIYFLLLVAAYKNTESRSVCYDLGFNKKNIGIIATWFKYQFLGQA